MWTVRIMVRQGGCVHEFYVNNKDSALRLCQQISAAYNVYAAQRQSTRQGEVQPLLYWFANMYTAKGWYIMINSPAGNNFLYNQEQMSLSAA